jgi:toxin ParE1/3/4
MKIIWTGKAEKQLDQIFRYIEVDSVLYAHRTVETIIERVESVALHPRMGRKVPEYQHEDIREIFHHPYRIIYMIRETDNIIEVISIIHGARILQ